MSLGPACLSVILALVQGAPRPLPEHPRPDLQRPQWLNLNGHWQFWFDTQDSAKREIVVPFSWGSPLSGVPDSGDIGWSAGVCRVRRVGLAHHRVARWPEAGRPPGRLHSVFVRAEEPAARRAPTARRPRRRHPPPLQARGQAGLRQSAGHVADGLPRGARQRSAGVRALHTECRSRRGRCGRAPARARGARTAHLDVPLPNARRWSLDDPFLHEVDVSVGGSGLLADQVQTYFGMRTIGVVTVPGTTNRYVALNGKPVYLQLALDQAYHPEGYYTFPTDSVLRDEILRARQIGLNGLREHVKIETPRKLYWADRLGVLIMADVPNWWGPPDSAAFREHDTALRGMIERDYNHPSVFSWVLFNETWGLETKVDGHDRYLPATERRVVRDYRLAKSLDPTRLVEDNSVCCGSGHTETDLNTWHDYL